MFVKVHRGSFLLNNDINLAEYARLSVVAREAAINMLSRLDWMTLKPARILDMGCTVGFSTSLLRERYPAALIFAADPSQAMLQYAQKTIPPGSVHCVCVDVNHLPIVQQGVDLIIANLVLPWCADIKTLLNEWFRILRPEGLLMLTSLGPDTLIELREHNIQLPHFMDMHDLGDALVQAGFSDPVVDVEHLTLKYRQWEQLLHELSVTKMIGSSPKQGENQPLSVTYEIVYGHAFGSFASSEYNSDENGVVRIPLSHLRKHRS
jgi:malonyl-CoA O-methyltransferase